MTIDDFYRVWEDSKKENILYQYYYDYSSFVEAERTLNDIRNYCVKNRKICKNEQSVDERECCIEQLEGVLQIIDKFFKR